jgi:pimeloyl-ACP methyl ester carboxylesterase
LARDLGFVPLYVRYNTGLSIATNGRALSRALEQLLRALEGSTFEVAILAHSMGGLVTRSALEHGRRRRHGWASRVRDLVFLGTPHHGAPLEQAGHGFGSLLGLSPYATPFARLVSARSIGITNLRDGRVDGKACRRVPLPQGIRCYAIAATLGSRRGAVGDRLLGDGLVPLDSALGRHGDSSRDLEIPPERQWIGRGIGHLDLLSHRDVYGRLRDWLA